MELPQVVSEEEWRRSREALLAKEKEATRARDGLAAERRRQPIMEFSTDYEFDGPAGVVKLIDVFEGRRQLIVYHGRGFKRRMGWSMPWYTAIGEEFQRAFGTTEYFALASSCATASAGSSQCLDVPRPDAAGSPGGVGGQPAGPPTDASLRLLAAARRVRAAGAKCRYISRLGEIAGQSWIGVALRRRGRTAQPRRLDWDGLLRPLR